MSVAPVSFTTDDFRARMERAAEAAADEGLDGLVVTPGPDLRGSPGTGPPPSPSGSPCWCSGATPNLGCSCRGWSDPMSRRPRAPVRDDQRLERRQRSRTRSPHRCCGPTASTRSRTRRGRCTCSACRARFPSTRYVAVTERLPMLRAVKDANELARMEAAGACRGCRVRRDREGAVRRPAGDRRRRRPRATAARVRARAGGLHGGRIGAQRRQSAPRGRGPDDRRGRHGRPGLRRAHARLRLGHLAHRVRGGADGRDARGARASCAWPSRPRSRPCARGSPARRSTARPGR